MPRGDASGPRGMGPMTGRGAGYCAGYGVPGYMNPAGGGGFGYGRGYGRGFGFGRGFGRGYGRAWAGAAPQALGYAAPYPPYGYAPVEAAPPAPTREQELDMLESQAKGFQQTLDDIRKRISDLESEKE